MIFSGSAEVFEGVVAGVVGVVGVVAGAAGAAGAEVERNGSRRPLGVATAPSVPAAALVVADPNGSRADW